MTKKPSEHAQLVREIMGFIKARKKFWLAPLIFVLIMIGSLFLVLEGSALAPLIYTIF
ncbi:MAG: DUF5989 family protein [Magnetospirillum sp. WYHS-4]